MNIAIGKKYLDSRCKDSCLGGDTWKVLEAAILKHAHDGHLLRWRLPGTALHVAEPLLAALQHVALLAGVLCFQLVDNNLPVLKHLLVQQLWGQSALGDTCNYITDMSRVRFDLSRYIYKYVTVVDSCSRTDSRFFLTLRKCFHKGMSLTIIGKWHVVCLIFQIK